MNASFMGELWHRNQLWRRLQVSTLSFSGMMGERKNFEKNFHYGKTARHYCILAVNFQSG